MRDVRRRLDYTLSEEGFTLTERIPDEPIPIPADPEALSQAVMNLLGNAMEDSGQSREIGLSVEGDGARASVHVIDHGAVSRARSKSGSLPASTARRRRPRRRRALDWGWPSCGTSRGRTVATCRLKASRVGEACSPSSFPRSRVDARRG